MKCYHIDISGMSCDHCVQTVRQAIQSTPGILACTIDLAAGRARVEIDPSQGSVSGVVEAVRAAGYAVNGFRQPPTESPGRP